MTDGSGITESWDKKRRSRLNESKVGNFCFALSDCRQERGGGEREVLTHNMRAREVVVERDSEVGKG